MPVADQAVQGVVEDLLALHAAKVRFDRAVVLFFSQLFAVITAGFRSRFGQEESGLETKLATGGWTLGPRADRVSTQAIDCGLTSRYSLTGCL